jgi:hypothetical protein
VAARRPFLNPNRNQRAHAALLWRVLRKNQALKTRPKQEADCRRSIRSLPNRLQFVADELEEVAHNLDGRAEGNADPVDPVEVIRSVSSMLFGDARNLIEYFKIEKAAKAEVQAVAAE